MRYLSVLFLPVLMLLAVCPLTAQGEVLSNMGPVVKKYESIDSQAMTDVTDMLQGKSGFIWLASRSGLLRFDGKSIKRFKHNPNDPNSLPGNAILALVQDKDGIIWLATQSAGLSRFNPATQRFTNFSHVAKDLTTIDSSQLKHLALGQQNRLWIGSVQGINHFDTKTFKNTRYNTSMQPGDDQVSESISAVFEDNQGRFWYGSKANGLAMYHPGTQKISQFKHIANDPNTLSDNRVTEIMQTANGDILIGTVNGLNQYEPTQKRFKRLDIPLKASNQSNLRSVIDILEDSKGRLWITTNNNGIVVRASGATKLTTIDPDFDLQDTLKVDYITSGLEDASGSLWFATKLSGLIQLSTNAFVFEHWKNPDNSNSVILSTFVDDKGTLWVGADKSLLRFNSQTAKFDKVLDNIGHVSGIKTFNDEQLALLVFDRGVYTYEPHSKKFESFVAVDPESTQPALNKVNAMDVSSDGELWIGYYNSGKKGGGVYYLDQSTKRYIKVTDKHTINALLVLPNHVLVGTWRNGLSIVDKSDLNITQVTNQNHDLSRIHSLYQDQQDRIWVGTGFGGFAQLDMATKSTSFVTTRQGLPSNSVGGIISDKNGILWVGTKKGLVRYQPNNGQIRVFGPSNGLRTSNLAGPAVTLNNSGDILMRNYKHLVRFSPKQLSALPQQPAADYPVLLSDFRLFNQPVPLSTGQLHTPLEEVINNVNSLSLSYQDYWFSLAFATSNFDQAQNIRFSYRLEGFNDNWITADDKNLTATFTSLPADDYILKIRTGNKNGDWHPGYRALNITVTPPWWKTGLAYLVYILTAVASIFAIHRYRTKALEQRANQLEQKVIERTATINQLMGQKQRMFANISHEFKTPLTLILNPLERILSKPSLDGLVDRASMMKRNAQRLLRMVDQLLELSKLETTEPGSLHHYSLDKTLSRLLTSFEPLFQSKKLTLKCVPFTDVVLTMIEESLEMILTNLLSNAIKYTSPGGTIAVTVSEQSNQVVIVIEDTGIGISEQNQQIVFNRFTRANEQHDENIPGAGIGLALVRELVDANQGSITLFSQINQGSKFTVTLPVVDANQGNVGKVGALSNLSQNEIDGLSHEVTNQVSQTTIVDDKAPAPAIAEPTVLMIDDNPDMLTLLTETLACNYHCFSATTGEAGLLMAKEHLPDLVLCDVMMPGLDGFEVLKQLKQDELTNHIPVVLLTAKGGSQSRIQGWTEKADEYLEKPFNATELLTRIENLLSIRSLLRHKYQRDFCVPKAASPANAPVNEQNALDEVNQAFVAKIESILAQHYADEDLSVGVLANKLAISNRQLTRKMRALLDLSPGESIRNYRLKKAAELLRQGTLSGIVAQQVGFSSHSYFSQCFKAQYDCMPSSFR